MANDDKFPATGDPLASISSTLFGPAGSQPLTTVRTDYSMTLHVTVGTRRAVVGGVYEFDHQQSLGTRDVFTVSANPDGSPAEVLPMALTGRTIRLVRYDLFRSIFEQLFNGGAPELVLLSDQISGLSLRERWSYPSVLIPGGGAQPTYEYLGCKITSLGRALNAEGDRISRTNASITWRTRRKIN